MNNLIRNHLKKWLGIRMQNNTLSCFNCDIYSACHSFYSFNFFLSANQMIVVKYVIIIFGLIMNFKITGCE